MERKILKVTVFKAGYEVREEEVTYSPHEPPTIMKSAYSAKGDYIGEPRMARLFINKYGITHFEPFEGSSRVVCYGYSPSKKKWYGWSHRAICGFGIGHKIFEPEFGDDKTLWVNHGTKTIETLEEAKEAAKAFAEYVS